MGQLDRFSLYIYSKTSFYAVCDVRNFFIYISFHSLLSHFDPVPISLPLFYLLLWSRPIFSFTFFTLVDTQFIFIFSSALLLVAFIFCLTFLVLLLLFSGKYFPIWNRLYPRSWIVLLPFFFFTLFSVLVFFFFIFNELHNVGFWI